MSAHLGYEVLRADTVRQIAKLMAAAAVTAPRVGGMLFLQGTPLFMETIVVDDSGTLRPPTSQPSTTRPRTPFLLAFPVPPATGRFRGLP